MDAAGIEYNEENVEKQEGRDHLMKASCEVLMEGAQSFIMWTDLHF